MIFFVFQFIDAGVSDCKCSVVVRSFVLKWIFRGTLLLSFPKKKNPELLRKGYLTQIEKKKRNDYTIEIWKIPQTQQKLNGYIYTHRIYIYIIVTVIFTLYLYNILCLTFKSFWYPFFVYRYRRMLFWFIRLSGAVYKYCWIIYL